MPDRCQIWTNWSNSVVNNSKTVQSCELQKTHYARASHKQNESNHSRFKNTSLQCSVCTMGVPKT